MASFDDNTNCTAKEWMRILLAEFLGTFLLVFVGDCAVAQRVLSDDQLGSSITVFVGYAMGIFLGVLVSAGVSGGHLNPSVTLAGALVNKVQWKRVPIYFIGQYFGAFVGAAATYLVYLDSFQLHHEKFGVNLTTAGILATFPHPGLSLSGAFIDQILGTAVLIVGVYATVDSKNCKVDPSVAPAYVALTLLAIGCSLGFNFGFAVNPARDLSPRIFALISSWGTMVFEPSCLWYVPVVGPHLGAVLGALVYIYLIEKHLPDEEDFLMTEKAKNLNVYPEGLTRFDAYAYRF